MSEGVWASDAIAALLRAQGFAYAALVPGSSFRGLHDSIVNALGNERPQMLVCLHEEHAVAIAHGYAKVANEPMLVLLHANVGLMHAPMAIYNAWCDRVPMLIVGANGPVDAAKRRPWIEWIHTSRDQAAMVRGFIKWDDAPASLDAALEAIVRADQLARTAPCGPAYVVLDTEMQEAPLAAMPALPLLRRFAPPSPAVPAPADVARIVAAIRGAKAPVLLLGRVARTHAAWDARVALAEAYGMRVIGDGKVGSTFPTRHPLHVGSPIGSRLQKEGAEVLRAADVIVSLESIDLAGFLRQALGDAATTISATVVATSLDRYVHDGANMDYQALPPVDIDLAVAPETLVDALLAVHDGAPAVAALPPPAGAPAHADDAPIDTRVIADVVQAVLAGDAVTYIRLPRGPGAYAFDHPLGFLGGDGGGGVGAGPGLAVGAALALRGTERLPVAILGDGDYLMGANALWTAVANGIPLLVVVANNRGYGNDIAHQERVAIHRGRPPERKTIGVAIDDPAPDCARFAEAQGARGIGPVHTAGALHEALAEAAAIVRAGGVCVVDAITTG